MIGKLAHPLEAPAEYLDLTPISGVPVSLSERTSKRAEARAAAHGVAFNLAVVRFLRSLRALPPITYWEGFRLKTNAGPLRIQPFGHWIALTFDDPYSAKMILPDQVPGELNPYSGKWHIHISGPRQTDEEHAAFTAYTLAELERRINRVRPHAKSE